MQPKTYGHQDLENITTSLPATSSSTNSAALIDLGRFAPLKFGGKHTDTNMKFGGKGGLIKPLLEGEQKTHSAPESIQERDVGRP